MTENLIGALALVAATIGSMAAVEDALNLPGSAADQPGKCVAWDAIHLTGLV